MQHFTVNFHVKQNVATNEEFHSFKNKVCTQSMLHEAISALQQVLKKKQIHSILKMAYNGYFSDY